MPYFSSTRLISFIVALSFAAGLNLYATVATLGLLARFGVVQLPAGLELLAHTGVLAAALVLFAVEMVADKIPFLDLAWNVAHTFIRVPVAALLAWRASQPLTPEMQALVTVAAAAIALAAHGGKTSVRAAVTPSPEPLSNIALSSAEDVASVALTWVATRHPVEAGVTVVFALVALGFGVRWGWRAARRQVGGFRQKWLGAPTQ